MVTADASALQLKLLLVLDQLQSRLLVFETMQTLMAIATLTFDFAALAALLVKQDLLLVQHWMLLQSALRRMFQTLVQS